MARLMYMTELFKSLWFVHTWFVTKVYTKSYNTLYAHDIFVSFSASEMVNKAAFLSRFFFLFQVKMFMVWIMVLQMLSDHEHWSNRIAETRQAFSMNSGHMYIQANCPE